MSERDTEPMENQAPIVKLVRAILDQSIVDGATKICLTHTKTSLRIDFFIEGSWKEAITVPKNLQNPFTRRLEIMAEISTEPKRLPHEGTIPWEHGQGKFNFRVLAISAHGGDVLLLERLTESAD
ncbi:MAG TPA: hypothetical protein VLE93_02540 [Candidatus Saccharimonadales bacterium]|nr:hypothetical protein [Candidatus Saccharimonadales bacterium]